MWYSECPGVISVSVNSSHQCVYVGNERKDLFYDNRQRSTAEVIKQSYIVIKVMILH